MITGKNSWKFLVYAFVIMLITIITGIFAYNSTIANPVACKIFGILNMVLGCAHVYRVYNQLKD